MPRKTVDNSWESLKKKVLEFEEYSGYPVILIGLIKNSYSFEGSISLKIPFAKDEEVVNKFRSALCIAPTEVLLNANGEENLNDVLQCHVFDMTVSMLRKIVDTAITPKDAITCKDKRKKLYQEGNAPRWWTDTGLPFISVNHKSGDTEQFRQVELWKLVESLQHHAGIIPNPPTKMPRNNTFISRFYGDCIATTSIATATIATATIATATRATDNIVTATIATDTIATATIATDTMATSTMTTATIATDTMATSTMATATIATDTMATSTMATSTIATDTMATSTMSTASSSLSSVGDFSMGVHNEDHFSTAERRREFITNLTLQQIQTYPKNIAAVLLKTDSWAELTTLSSNLLQFVNTVQDIPAVQWDNEEYLLDKFSNANPSFRLIQSTADGNCMFNAVSIIMHGNEEFSFFYRLMVTVDAVDRLPELSKYILKEYKDNWGLWLSMVSDDIPSTDTETSPSDIIEQTCMAEMKRTLRSFHKDCSILHIILMAQYFNRPIQQHCFSDGTEYDLFRQLILPPFDNTKRPPLHLVWVPSPANKQTNSIGHIVPAVCSVGPYGIPSDHCPLLVIGCCVFQSGANYTVSADVVKCSTCGHLVHCACAHVSLTESGFSCGCTLYSTKYKLKNAEIYQTLSVEEELEHLNIPNYIQNVCNRPGIRKFLCLEKPHFSQSLKGSILMRTGPFLNDQVNRDIMMYLARKVPTGMHMFVPDLFLQETFLQILVHKEEISRLTAEFILNGHYQP